jgi:tRNA/rRNA methyltransferase
VSAELENLVVVLVRTRNPLNLGAVARAMSNFGAAELRAVRPYGKAWREARSAVGAGEVMARAKEFATLDEAIADCTLVVGTTSVGNREMKHPLHDLAQVAPLLHERMRAGRVAVLFGSEKWGLSNEELSYCHWLLRIPTREEHRSMNLGQAAAVLLYEMGGRGRTGERGSKGFETTRLESGPASEETEAPGGEASRSKSAEKKRRKGLAKAVKRATASENESTGSKSTVRLKKAEPSRQEMSAFAEMEVVERIGETLLKALKKSGYVGQRKDELAEEKLRRMLRRFSLSAADAEVFLGMIRKIEKELVGK